jgi:hypothetical protein
MALTDDGLGLQSGVANDEDGFDQEEFHDVILTVFDAVKDWAFFELVP